MGCDIHAVFQGHHGCEWSDLAGLKLHRSYRLFAWLAGVRNSWGITPISEPRGLPKDFKVDRGRAFAEEWLGGHSYSWLWLDEILAAPNQTFQVRGLVSRSAYVRGTRPSNYFGGVSGPNVVIHDERDGTIPTSATHVVQYWEETVHDSLKWFIDGVRSVRAAAPDSPCRMVMGFDS